MSAHSEIMEALFAENRPPVPPPRRRWSTASFLRLVPLLNRFTPATDEKQQLVEKLRHEQKAAVTYAQWHAASTQLDELTGKNEWKQDPSSPAYDHELLQQNTEALRQARLANDHRLLLYLVRTKFARNVGNMGHSTLYRHSHVGTKRIIEEYVDECQLALQHLVEHGDGVLDDHYLLGMLIQTRQTIGRTALLLSGGSTFGVSHIGVLIALLENNLLPRVINGSSAGSVIASILCTHTNDETQALLGNILERPFNFFGSPSQDDADGRLKSLLSRIGHLLKYGTVFDISGVRETVYDFVGDLTFREAYNRTGKILNITVSPASMHEQTRLLNYLTAPHCLIWSAVCASCSVPGIFASNSIYEKNPATGAIREWNNDQSSKFVDGSVDADLPITTLSEMFNVDHIIAVQVNPHISPVLKVCVGDFDGESEPELAATLRGIVGSCYDFMSSEIVHYLQVMHELNIQRNLTSKLISLFTQRYSGDITILPALTPTDYLSLFSNPGPDFVLQFILKGARAAWPKISMIKNHCAIEFELDRQISMLRGRLISRSNNLIAPKAASDAVAARAIANNAYLISSPVMNSDSDSPQANEEPGMPKLPKIRRHNSTGNTPKKNGFSETAKFRPKRKYTDSYLSGPPKNNALLPSLKSSVDISTLSQFDDPFLDEDQCTTEGLKKARSSGNFQTQSASADHSSNRINFRTSPKHEKTIHYTFDYENFAARLLAQEAKQPQESPTDPPEKAYLPRVSKSISTHNSAIGLNMLKDSIKSISSKNSSSNNSSQNLRDFYNENHKTFRNLNSPDLRRQLSKTRFDSEQHTRPARTPSKSNFKDVPKLEVSNGHQSPEEEADSDSTLPDTSVHESTRNQEELSEERPATQ